MDAAKLEALLRKAVVNDTYETEYDGRMYDLCVGCGKQDDQRHASDCWIIEAKILLGIPT